MIYHPQLLGSAEVRFSDKRVDTTRQLTLLAPITDGVVTVDWDQASVVDLPISDLEQTPEENAQFAELAGAGRKGQELQWLAKRSGGLALSQSKTGLVEE